MKKIFLFLATLLTSCQSNWLDVKPDQKMVVVSTVKDLRALMDNAEILNTNDPDLGEVSADNLNVLPNIWQALNISEQKNAVIWAKEIFGEEPCISWESPYQKIFYSNLAIEKYDALSKSEKQLDESKDIKGVALFFRAWSYFQLVQIFCDSYSTNSKDLLGLPLRLESDMAIVSVRSSLQDTYLQIERDLHEAIPLMVATPVIKTRPSKHAGFALLAKLYLQMGKYSEALEASETALSFSTSLMDYNLQDDSKTYPFDLFNNEVIFHSTLRTVGILASSRLDVDKDLISSYKEGDLRKILFYIQRSSGLTGFRGAYSGGVNLFGGLSTNELFLIAAECHARLGDVDKSLDYVNTLLEKRFQPGYFMPIEVNDSNQLLLMILKERRKELPFRGIRWHDLKRLTEEFNISLTRVIGSNSYNLRSGDKKWILPFPEIVIKLTNMPQNER